MKITKLFNILGWKSTLLLLFLAFCYSANSQVLVYNFDDSPTANPYTTAPSPVDAQLSNFSWTNTVGAFSNIGGNTGSSLSISNSSGTPSYTLTFDIAAGCELNLSGFSFWARRSNTGAQNWDLKVNGTSVGTGTVPTSGSVISGTCSMLLTGTVTITLELSGGSSVTGSFRLDDFTLNGSVSCLSSNTITASNLSSTSYSVDCTTGANSSIDFTSDGVFNAGNTFTAQLSNATGSFASPTSIGNIALSGTDPSGTINFTIPAQTASGSNYLIRIVSSNPVTTSNSTTTITITLTGAPCVLTQPHITSLIYNGCNSIPSCSGVTEGITEIVFANTGGYSLLAISNNIDINYPGSPAYDIMGSVVNNSTTTAAINTQAGCGTLYLDGYNQTIPPNSIMLFLPSNIPVCAFDWSSMCGQGPVYVIYGQSGSSGDTWHTGGNFGNSSGVKNFSVSFTTTDGTTHTNPYSYNGGSGDGAYATYGSNPVGGSAATQGVFTNCAFDPIIVLGSEVVSFTGEKNNGVAYLNWRVETERNNDYFSIHRSTDGVNWTLIDNVDGRGSATTLKDYQLIDFEPEMGVNYYRLTSTEFNGQRHTHGIIPLEFNQTMVHYDAANALLKFKDNVVATIYAVNGDLVAKVNNQNSINFTKKGMFIIHYEETGTMERLIIAE